jgi:hypothetical protein
MDSFKLLPWQQTVFDNPTRFRIVAGGRRVGKTVLCVHEAYRAAQAEYDCHVAYVVPYQRMATETVWHELLKAIPSDDIQYADRTKLTIKLKISDSTIHIFSAQNVDSRTIGRYFSFAIYEEPSYMSPSIFMERILPCLSFNRGKALIVGTPARDHGAADKWFHNLYLKGQDSKNTEYFSFGINV